MIQLRKIEQAAERIVALLPGDAGLLREDLKQALKPLIESVLSRMDLVTREEFEAQSLVLLRTREKLETLAEKLTELEQSHGQLGRLDAGDDS